ncbi:hypothetical protein ASQ50_06140 [Marinobacter sp. LQ44]|nr:hypothetical protein ASQ50_06140 [Marinobacter sp. LQ44]
MVIRPPTEGGVVGDHAAFFWRKAFLKVGKESAMVGFGIGVWVAGRIGGHKTDVGLEEGL